METKSLASVVLCAALAAPASSASAASKEEDTLQWIATIRAIKSEGGREETKRYNEQMDGAWKFFNANKSVALPLLRKEVASELKSNQRNQMVLLDIGYYLRLQQEQADKALGREAFFAIDPSAEIVKWNQQQLFHFAHTVVPDRDPRTLGFLDKAVLRGKVTAFIPQHALTLDETLVAVFLYGIYGQGAESHLKAQLSDRSVARRIIEVLVWMGSPESVPEVTAAMMADRTFDTFVRATSFMMSTGGPSGRAAMLAVRPADFDTKSQEYYAKVRKSIETVNYKLMYEQFSGFPGSSRLSDAEIKTRLTAMHKNYGKDDKTNPKAILDSGLPPAFLVTELSRIRNRMFFRVSDEALSDVTLTTALITALHYKASAKGP